MNWLNPEQVREWLEANSPHVSGYHEETIDPEAVKYAWKQFGLAIAAEGCPCMGATMSTNKRARELAKMWHCRCCPCDHTGHTLIVKEIAEILDVLAGAKRWLPDAHKSTLGCPAIYDLSICNCYVKPLIEKIDAILEGK